ncbi:MAG TPA: hypothetical protein VFM35_09085, partial [Candidatus Binatia bacterium]|nr:hypothetical protein [Candidatus Binatia bacterium]
RLNCLFTYSSRTPNQPLRLLSFPIQIRGDFAELFEGGFEIFDDFLSENIGIAKVIGFFEVLVSEIVL